MWAEAIETNISYRFVFSIQLSRTLNVNLEEPLKFQRKKSATQGNKYSRSGIINQSVFSVIAVY